MADVTRACEIAAELEKTAAWRNRGRTVVAVGSVLLSAMPLGGSIASLVQEVGTRFFDAELEDKFSQLCGIVGELEPQLEKIEALESRVAGVATALNGVEGLLQQLINRVQSKIPKEFIVKTVEASQSFTDVTIRI